MHGPIIQSNRQGRYRVMLIDPRRNQEKQLSNGIVAGLRHDFNCRRPKLPGFIETFSHDPGIYPLHGHSLSFDKRRRDEYPEIYHYLAFGKCCYCNTVCRHGELRGRRLRWRRWRFRLFDADCCFFQPGKCDDNQPGTELETDLEFGLRDFVYWIDLERVCRHILRRPGYQRLDACCTDRCRQRDLYVEL